MLNTFIKLLDYRNHEYFLIKSNTPITIILLAYLGFVYKFGPDLMRNRRPFQLKTTIILYNIVQIVLNTYIFVKVLGNFNKVNEFCAPIVINNDIFKLIYFYHVLKIIDLLDTVFFVLRKKQNQVSVLHVYHHVSVVICSWFAAKFYPNGLTIFTPLLNTFAHMVMYFYYLLTITDPKRRNLWWKKHITQIQLIHQLLLLCIYLVPFLNDSCLYPKTACYIVLPNLFVIVTLFGHFYIKHYLSL